jgi:hypothetical protein
MKNEELIKIRKLWNLYDQASNKETDYFIKSLEASRQGNKTLAEYIDKKILPRLKNKAYKFFLAYEKAFNKYYGK